MPTDQQCLGLVLIAGKLCSREVIPAGAEWMSENELKKAFGRKRYRMGWWDKGDGPPEARGRRFGIDVEREHLLGVPS